MYKEKNTPNILTLNHDEAMDFFMKSEQYHTFELPEYFVFDEVLKYVRESVGDTPYEDCLQTGVTPDEQSGVNLDILLSKDGKYAVRPIILANPFLYYFLVREVCNEEGWTIVKALFERFSVPHITPCAIPVQRAAKEAFHNSTTILNWWKTMEQRTIELSLEYRYMFMTDITNCYGSVDPQTFDWAFQLKDTQYEKPEQSVVAQNIRKYLRAFQLGRNIGIPQGSTIFDFVAEIILGYSDLLLHEALQAKAKQYEDEGKIFPPYEIIRYRDDYRVFCNDKNALEDISYTLQQILEHLNFRMNSSKTKISDSIVTDAVKPDKLAYIYNTPIFNKKGCDFDSFEKHLLYILMFGREYPDCSSLMNLLSDIDERIDLWINPDEADKKNEDGKSEDEDAETDEQKKTPKRKRRFLPGGSARAMSAICVQIALENVKSAHHALRVMSRLVESLKDEEEKWDIRDKVYAKLCNQPNSTYNQLWLQNITYQRDKKTGASPYTMPLCQFAAGNEDVAIWNNDWLKSSLSSDIPCMSIIDGEKLKSTTPIITFRESRGYDI